MAAAAKSLDICTIGKMRSYHSEIDGKLFFSHLNDIHILWGKHSLDRYLKKVESKNYHLPQLFFLNGYSHTSNLKQNEHQNILQSIKNKFKKNSVNKIILLLDTSIENSNSDSSSQILSRKFAIKFFTFFNLLSENKNLGIIVKSKITMYLSHYLRIIIYLIT